MALITNFEQLRAFVKFISSSDAAGGMISTLSAELRYVQPVVTAALYNELNIAVAADAVPENKQDLLTLCRAVAAPMSVYHNIALVQVNITDTGLKTADTENFQSAHRWEYMEVKEQLIDQGSLAVESLITYLVENATTLGWLNPDYSGSIFKTGNAFSDYFFLHQPHRTFMSLRPLIREGENYIINLVGRSFYNSLKAIAEPSENESILLDLMKTFVANYTINKAIEKLSVAITPAGLTVLLSSARDKGNDGQRNAPDNQLSLLYNSTKADAKLFLSKVKKHADSKAGTNVFDIYFSSEFYTAPGTAAAASGNCERKGIFGF